MESSLKKSPSPLLEIIVKMRAHSQRDRIYELLDHIKSDPTVHRHVYPTGHNTVADFLMDLNSLYPDDLSPYLTAKTKKWTCSCCLKTFTENLPDEILSIVPIPHSSKPLSISDVLKKHFFYQESLFCPNCKGKTFSKVSTLLTSKFLIIDLQRFSIKRAVKRKEWTQNKRSIQIKADRKLELPGSPKYQLIGVIHHQGTMTSGHYWANIMTKDGKWWELNDSVQKPIIVISGKTLQIAIYVKAEHFQLARKNII